MRTMKAIVVESPGPPEFLELRTVPIPEPGPAQARVRVAYCVLNPLDTHARADRIKWKAPGFPFTPGYEYSGRVEAVGEGVPGELVGQRVVSVGQWGGCAEHAVAMADRLIPIPDEFEWKLGTVFFTCAYSAWHVLHTAARLQQGQTILLHSAAGAVGILTTQIAKEAGATVIGLCSPDKFDFARPFGADHLISSRDPDWVSELRERTGGRGVDLIVDGVAGPEAPKNYEALAPLGQVIYIGAVAGPPPPVNISQELYFKSISVRGFVVYTAMAATGGREKPSIHEALASGRWKIPISEVVPLSKVVEMHRRHENRELFGRTLFEIGGEI